MNPNLMTPKRLDLALFTNSDHLVVGRWVDPETGVPVAIYSAVLTLRFDQLAKTFDADGNVVPPPPPVVKVIDEIDDSGFPDGIVRAWVRAWIWPDLEGRTGEWDLLATDLAGGLCVLLRGEFVAEDGISAVP